MELPESSEADLTICCNLPPRQVLIFSEALESMDITLPLANIDVGNENRLSDDGSRAKTYRKAPEHKHDLGIRVSHGPPPSAVHGYAEY